MTLEHRDSSITPRVLDIIVVDDSQDITEGLAELLGLSGHRVRIASDGASALEALAERAPDVVLLDVGLPDMDGYDVAATIRARFGPRPRIIAITGFAGSDARERALRSGFDAVLVKPFAIEAVEAALMAPMPGSTKEVCIA